MASDAIESGSPANNPRVPSYDEIKELYRECFNYKYKEFIKKIRLLISEYSIKISLEMKVELFFIISVFSVKTRLYIPNLKSCFIMYNIHNKTLLLVL